MELMDFKWKHYQPEIIMLCCRWYLKFSLSYRNLEEIMNERGLTTDHTTIMRWVHQYSPEINKRIGKYLRPTNNSYRVDETYVKVRGRWTYLYRAVDSNGDTIDFMLSPTRSKIAAKRFFKKVIKSPHNKIPRVISVDKNPSYPAAIDKLKEEVKLPKKVKLRQVKYLNNIIEQDHRAIKRIIRPMMGFKSFKTSNRTLQGIEAMNMIRKGQVDSNKSVLFEVEFINKLFRITS
jgi:transposase, IS6 family